VIGGFGAGLERRPLKLAGQRAEKSGAMPYVHECLFCGFSRQAEAAAIVRPTCEECGCVLVSSPSGGQEVAMPALDRAPMLPRGLVNLAKAVAAATLMVAATKAGYDAGGAWIAGVGFSVAGLVAVPALVPAS
jgi:hypothetical protein